MALRISGFAGGSWVVERHGDAWLFVGSATRQPQTIVSLDEETAWRGFTRGIGIDEVRANAHITGDQHIGETLLTMISIIA